MLLTSAKSLGQARVQISPLSCPETTPHHFRHTRHSKKSRFVFDNPSKASGETYVFCVVHKCVTTVGRPNEADR